MREDKNKSKLIIVGNGFDLMHGLPTRFIEDFKPIAESIESGSMFWDYYGHGEDLWSNFEILLGNPDFNELFELLNEYYPDYSSDRESDRNAIITQVDLIGNLVESLNDFAKVAEESLKISKRLDALSKYLNTNDYYISFNYTSTLETLYGVLRSNIFYPHGKVGESSKLIMGYESGNFNPEVMYEEYNESTIDVLKYIDNREEYYSRTAYKNMYNKIKSFKKTPNISELSKFIDNIEIDEIVIIGHSCRVDFDYFETINNNFKEVNWTFYYYSDDDYQNINKLCKRLALKDKNINTIKNNFK